MERAARQRQPLELLARGGDRARVAVAEVQRGVAGEAVEVATAVDVGDPGAVAFVQHDGQRVIGVRGVRLVEGDVLSRARVGNPGYDAQAARQHVAAHARNSSVQHFGPPPALRSSLRLTGTG